MSEKKFIIKNTQFITSVGVGTESYPGELAAEIAIAGKSNVGKSSLINSLCNNYKLAKTSQTPGKTRLINYFKMNDELYIVDLPGYGFAKAPKTQQLEWGALIEGYLSSGRVTHIILLIDIRHPPTVLDKQMFNWILYYGVPFTIVATKADKVPRSKKQSSANAAAKALGAPPAAIAYSSVDKSGRDELITRIGDIFYDAKDMQDG